MPYFRIDDAFPQHRKVLAIPRKDRVATVGLWTLAGIWCAGQLTDGQIAEHMVEELGSTKRYADLLVKVGLWERTEGGYAFHDFVYWQGASREDVLAKRAEEAERKRKWREAKAAKRAEEANPVLDVSQRDNPRTDNGTTASVPDVSGRSPLLPIPSLPTPSHPSVPYGDREDGSSWGGSVTEADAHASNAPHPESLDRPPRCLRHQGLAEGDDPPCRACQRLRENWEMVREEAAKPKPLPPLCGQCDNRWVETDRGMDRCPRCNPQAVAS